MAKKKDEITLAEAKKFISDIGSLKALAALQSTAPGKLANSVGTNLETAVLGFNPGGPGTQLSQVDTIFVNMRWYLISNMRQPLNEAYVEIGVVKTVVDVPVEDAMRGGMKFSSKQLSPEQLEELHQTIEQEDDIAKMSHALKWNRLFGGAGVIIVTDQDPETPLDLDSIKEGDFVTFKDCDMWELYWDQMNIEGDGEPLDYPGNDYYRYYGKKIHKSRVLIMRGIRAPSFIRPRLRGWGLSVVEVLVRSINQYLKANDLTFEVLDEFKIDIYKIKNLTATLMSAEGTNAVHNRIRIANLEKNYQNAITMDAEDDYAQKELGFQGLAETMVGIRMQIASDLRMPLTKVFGISASGFSSGEDDIENYNAMVESSLRMPAKTHLIKMAQVRCASLFGFVPEDLTGEYLPLRILSSEQQENVKNAVFNRLLAAATAGQISSKEFKDGCNKDRLFPIQVDTTRDTVGEKMELEAKMATEGSEGGTPKAGPESSLNAKEAKS